MSSLAEVLLGLPWGWLLPFGPGRGQDRRLLREGRARCGLRSVTGRVLNIGTEWSAGKCNISPGRIQFSPTFGIVGDRDIEVLKVLSSSNSAIEFVDLGLGQTVTHIIRTVRGDFYWALPDVVAKDVIALLSQRKPDASRSVDEPHST